MTTWHRIEAAMIQPDVADGNYTLQLVDKWSVLVEAVERLNEEVDRLRAIVKECGSMEQTVLAIESYESWTDGEPSLGTCRLLGQIKDQSRRAQAASEDTVWKT